MSVQGWKIVTVVGAVVLAVGLLIGVIPVSSGGSSCGSVFFGADKYLTSLSCGDLRSVVRIPVIVLVALGAVATAAGGMMWNDAAARVKSQASAA